MYRNWEFVNKVLSEFGREPFGPFQDLYVLWLYIFTWKRVPTRYPMVDWAKKICYTVQLPYVPFFRVGQRRGMMIARVGWYSANVIPGTCANRADTSYLQESNLPCCLACVHKLLVAPERSLYCMGAG